MCDHVCTCIPSQINYVITKSRLAKRKWNWDAVKISTLVLWIPVLLTDTGIGVEDRCYMLWWSTYVITNSSGMQWEQLISGGLSGSRSHLSQQQSIVRSLVSMAMCIYIYNTLPRQHLRMFISLCCLGNRLYNPPWGVPMCYTTPPPPHPREGYD